MRRTRYGAELTHEWRMQAAGTFGASAGGPETEKREDRNGTRMCAHDLIWGYVKSVLREGLKIARKGDILRCSRDVRSGMHVLKEIWICARLFAK